MKKNKKNQTKRITTYVIVAVVLIAALYLISNNIAGLTDTTSDYDYSRQNNPEYYSLLPLCIFIAVSVGQQVSG